MDEFDDDDFDDLNETTLQELEKNAIQATQGRALSQAPPNQPSQASEYAAAFEDDDLDDSIVTDGLRGTAVKPVDPFVRSQAPRAAMPPPPARVVPIQGPASTPTSALSRVPTVAPRTRYPSVQPLNTTIPSQRYPGASIQHARLPQPQQPIGTQFAHPPPPTTQSQFLRAQQPVGAQYAPGPSQPLPPPSQNSSMVEALKARIRILEEEVNTTRGEIAVVRANLNRSVRDHDLELSRLKKQYAEQLAKQEKIAESARHAEKAATTELQFTRRDLKDELAKARKKNASTPKKATRSFGLGDGFDDNELAPSPTKSQSRAKSFGSVAPPLGDRTPTKGKRKRPVVDSPVMPLEIDDGDVVMHDGTPAREHVATPEPLPPKLSFDFLQLVLDHHTTRDRPPTFEVLTRYALPGGTGTPFSNLLFQKIHYMGDPNDPTALLVDFCTFTLELWNECLSRQYFEPISDLLALVAFTLQLHSTSVVPRILFILVPVATSTCYPMCENRYNESADEAYYAKTARYISVSRILSLLRFVAQVCSTAPIDHDSGTNLVDRKFWSMIPPRLVFMMLSYKQLPEDYHAMLRLLQVSALPDSIGPISDDQPVAFMADSLINRLANHLIELPASWAVTHDGRYALQLAILRTLAAFATSPVGIIQLAQHPKAIPRLVTVLSAALDALYDTDRPTMLMQTFPSMKVNENASDPNATQPAPVPVFEAVTPVTTQTLNAIIRTCMHLLHKLVTDARTASTVDLESKLSAVPGCSQRYLLTLARLNFVEDDMVLERGIDAETADLAHELLDLRVGPEESKGLLEVFGAE